MRFVVACMRALPLGALLVVDRSQRRGARRVLLPLYGAAHVLSFVRTPEEAGMAWTLLGLALAGNAALALCDAVVAQQSLLGAYFGACLAWVGSCTHFCVLWLAASLLVLQVGGVCLYSA